MKYITFILLFVSLSGFAQVDYEVVEIDSVTFVVKTTQELANGQIQVDWLPRNGYLTAEGVTDYLLGLAEENAAYKERSDRRGYKYDRQKRYLNQMVAARDTNYYDFTWSKYAEGFASSKRYILAVNGDRFEASMLVNQAGRLILQTDGGNSAVRIETPRSISIVNIPEIGANADLTAIESDSKRIVYRGESENGKNIALIRVR